MDNTEHGRSPAGPGYSAEPGPISVVPAVPVSIPNAEEAETERERRVANSPFGIHEALHTCSVLMDTFGCRVAEHPAVALRPDILAKAEIAIERMMDVYQALGALPEWSEGYPDG